MRRNYPLISKTVMLAGSVLVLAVPLLLSAQGYEPLQKLPGIEGSNVTLATYLPAIFQIGVALAAIFAVVKIVIGGFQYMTSEVVNTKAEARRNISSAIGGLLLVLAAFVLLQALGGSQFTNVDLLVKPIVITRYTPAEEENREIIGYNLCRAFTCDRTMFYTTLDQCEKARNDDHAQKCREVVNVLDWEPCNNDNLRCEGVGRFCVSARKVLVEEGVCWKKNQSASNICVPQTAECPSQTIPENEECGVGSVCEDGTTCVALLTLDKLMNDPGLPACLLKTADLPELNGKPLAGVCSRNTNICDASVIANPLAP